MTPWSQAGGLAQHIPRDPTYNARSEVGSLPTSLTAAGSVDFSLILPRDHSSDRATPYPLILSLHPGAANRDHLIMKDGFTRTGRDVLPPREVVWACFSCGPPGWGMYMNKADGSDQWEYFVIREFIPFVETNYNCGGHQSRRYITGICMGGLGTLKFAFKYPRLFAGAAAQQPSMICGADGRELPWNDLLAATGFDAATYGATEPPGVDVTFFRRFVSPVAMCEDNAAEIRASGIKIYLDVGDQDFFNLHNAAELMHRVLWHQRIEHEYHLVHGANHAGSSWRRRGPEAMDFLFRVMEDAIDPPPPVLTPEEAEWVAWVAKGRPTDIPEPPMPKKFDGVPQMGTFQDDTNEYTRALLNPNGRYGGPTDGPAEIMGYKWRAQL